MKKWVANASAVALAMTLLSAGGSYADQDLTKVIGPKVLPTVGKSDAQKGAQIILRETERDAWGKGEEFVFMLPEGVTWGNGTKVNGEDPHVRGRELIVYFNGTRGLDEIVLDSVVDVQRKVPLGNVEFSVQNGPVSATKSRIAIAKVSDFGLVMNARQVRNIAYGDRSLKTVRLELKELIDGSLLRGAGYELTLQNAKFDQKMTPSVRELEGIKKLKAHFAEDALVLSTDSASSKTAWEITFGIIPDENYSGDITVQLKGRETNETAVIATVNKDMEASMEEMKNISLGYREQSVADIKLTESKERVLMKGSYVLAIDPAYESNSVDTVKLEVVDGDLEVSNVRYKGNQITFDVVKESTKPSVLLIKDTKVTLSAASFLGEYKAVLTLQKKDKEEVKFAEMVWFNATAPTKDPSKPAPARVAQFVIDKTNYDLFLKGEKEEKTFDVAPYIESGRTMMSVKAVAEALDMDVDYDAATKTVSISSKGVQPKTVQMMIGEKKVLVDGKPVPIDVAPMIKDGRTFVPVSYVGKFFDAKTEWDAGLKMITLTVE